ncbi:MAG: SDR family oxidoreductase [Candidatus Thorarchaeota archaeon]|nr:SDR family oxidoreductase [Candidatus Thorarchaeota archaeon]
MNLQLEERTFLVTAASKGLGLSVAKALVDDKANVIICGRTESSLKNAVESLGNRAQYFVADVSQSVDVESLFDFIKEQTSKLDGLFVNAGGPPPGTFTEISDETWLKSVDLTLMSAVRLTRTAIPLLKESDSPSILYSTSISVKQPISNLLLSNALRPAVIGMMRTLSDEIGPEGIRVNAVCPGYIYTDRVNQLMAAAKSKGESTEENIIDKIPLGRMGTPKEFGNVCAFILSPLASYVHGALLLIDGGLYKGMM